MECLDGSIVEDVAMYIAAQSMRREEIKWVSLYTDSNRLFRTWHSGADNEGGEATRPAGGLAMVCADLPELVSGWPGGLCLCACMQTHFFILKRLWLHGGAGGMLLRHLSIQDIVRLSSMARSC